MKVSIITVCHNQLAHTKRFINSLKRYTPQEPHQWELIAVDSGSTDGTREWLVQNGIPHFQNDENIGWIKGINLGFKEIDDDSEIVIFANNDVVLDAPGWLERLCKHFDNPAVGAVGPTSNYVIGRQHVSCNVPHVTEEETRTLVGFFFAVRREVVEQIGSLEEQFHAYVPEYAEDARRQLSLGGADDLDYSKRIRDAGWKLVIARDVFVWHAGSKTFMDVVGKDGYEKQWRLADLAYERKWGKGSREECFAPAQRFAFGLPMRTNHPNWLFSRSLMYLQKPPQWDTIEMRRCVIDQARCKIAETAVQLGSDWLLFLDDDHILPPDLVYRLMSHGKDVVGALAFRRVAPFGPCVFSWQTNQEDGKLMVVDRPDLIRKGLQRVDAIGFAAVLIKCDVFKRLGPPPWFKVDEVGEDLHFCDLCAQAGIDVWCDTDLIVPHINDDGIAVDDSTFAAHHQWKAARG